MPETKLNRIFLTKILGATAGLIQGDFLMGDRWRWLRDRLPRTANGETLMDVGCGSGAFTICAAQRGYKSLGLTWDESDTKIATERASLCRAAGASFRICDVRQLDEQPDLRGAFDFAICCENIEHILDDRRLVKALYSCLKPGGRLLLTTPNYYYRPIVKGDRGPFRPVEDGWHVRRGYSKGQLRDLFTGTGFIIESISYCGGFSSQKLTGFLRLFRGKSYALGWAVTLPARLVVPLVDGLHRRMTNYPPFSICLEAYKAKWS
jgi:SAM-dependent methyltransferase